MGLFDGMMDSATRPDPETSQKVFGQGLAKTFAVLSWVCVLALAPASVEAADAASGPPAAITPDGGRYWGPLVGGVRQGEGRVEWSDGSMYVGGFVNGMFSGKGRLRTSAGEVVEGDFKEGLASGVITMTMTDGSVYQGLARMGRFEGRGRLKDDKTVYEGEFQNNLYHGQGHLKAPAFEYTGEFRQGHYWGRGELRHNGGRSYKGEFVRGEFQGHGRYAIAQGPVYEGDFVEGKLQGRGVVTYPNGARQEGNFRDWMLEGPGKWTDEGGRTIAGEFKAGELHGTATSASPNGTRYTGEMQNWMPHGQGELRLANGDVYRGGFRHGVYDGQGTLTYAKAQSDGRSEDAGLWEYGRLKKQVEEERRLAQANAERALYAQPAQLKRALDELQPSSGSGINLYLLAVAGDGSQEVFRREVDFIRNQFEERFGTRGRSILLVNSRNTVGLSPLATVTSIRVAISAIAAKMNKDRDILFLYVTSHGSREGTISLGLDGMRLPDLNRSELAAVMAESGIRWKVVVVSACYSGGFMEPLKDPGTLFIAAARADRQSFGCADENDFTYFGRAFFKESLPSADSFEDAFSRATKLIREWEDRDAGGAAAASGARQAGKEPAADRYSLPQIDAPEPIRQHLKLWRQQLSTKAGRLP
jgi:hypothetical protein